MLRERWLVLVLALSSLLAVFYAVATPLGAAPDESAHLRYIEVLATEGRLPVMDLARRRANPAADRDFEAHQPPLYYALNVPAYWLGRALGGGVGIGWACRVLSILIGLIGVVLIRRLAAELAPGRDWLQGAATVLVAFLPMRLATMASINNDGLAEVLSTLALLAMARMVASDHHGSGSSGLNQVAILGGIIALGLLTKATAILLLPPALLAVYFASGARDPGRETGAWQGLFLRDGVVLGGVLLLVAGWWFLRNQALYGDPLAKRLFDEYFADTPRWTSSPVRLGFQDELGISFLEYMGRMVLPTTFASFWGAFGHLVRPELFMGGYNPNHLREPAATLIRPLEALWPILELDGKFFIPYKSWLYPLLVVAVVLSLAGWVAAKARPAIRNRASDLPPAAEFGAARARWIAGLHAFFVVAALLNFNATYFQGQGRYLLPAIGALALALTGGWLAWSARHERALAALTTAGMLTLALYALTAVLLPGFRAG